MTVHTCRARTREIVEQYRKSRAEHSSKGSAHHERLIKEAIRLLRENKADCVRDERCNAERIGGERWAADGVIDLGYEDVKAEIDEAIASLLTEKIEIRMANANALAVAATPIRSGSAIEKLETLADLHSTGVLTEAEFVAAKQRLS